MKFSYDEDFGEKLGRDGWSRPRLGLGGVEGDAMVLLKRSR